MSTRRAAGQAHAYRGNIFIVEDDASLSHAVTRLLEAAGFRARAFGSAEAALADRGLHEADCFVLDIHLPGISGFELNSRLDSIGVHAPVVLITAHDDPLHRRTAGEIGAVAYLTKPFSSVALIDAVVREMEPGEQGRG